MAKDIMSIGKKSTGSESANPSVIGGNKESTVRAKKIITTVNTPRKEDSFSVSASKKGFGISTAGGC